MSEPGFAPLRPPQLAQARVAVVGLGLMGGSLAAALRARRACARVVGVARRAETVSRALELGFVDEGTSDLAAGVAETDVVVLALPVRAILRTLPTLGPMLPPGALLLDLGSTKAAIAAAMEGLPGHVHVCPAHPMCGKEVSGLEAADAGLYAGQVFALCPLPRTRPEALALAEALVHAAGARPLRLDAARHDRLVAVTSHLPYLLAAGLTAAAEGAGQDDALMWSLAASGFRDTSRLAASDVAMMLDVLLTNRERVSEALERCREQLERLEQLVRQGDEASLRAAMEAAATRRRGLF